MSVDTGPFATAAQARRTHELVDSCEGLLISLERAERERRREASHLPPPGAAFVRAAHAAVLLHLGRPVEDATLTHVAAFSRYNI
jgi:hypothetical protein